MNKTLQQENKVHCLTLTHLMKRQVQTGGDEDGRHHEVCASICWSLTLLPHGWPFVFPTSCHFLSISFSDPYINSCMVMCAMQHADTSLCIFKSKSMLLPPSPLYLKKLLI